MYKKDLLWDWMFAQFFDYGWYLDYSKDTTPLIESGIKEKSNPSFLEHLAFSKNQAITMNKKRGKGKTFDPALDVEELQDVNS